MAAARRFYCYVASGIGLALVAFGSQIVVRLNLEAAGFSKGLALYQMIPGSLSNRDRADLSEALACVLVGLPVWLIHWIACERIATQGDADGEAERVSATRSFFFLVSMSLLLWVGAGSLVSCVQGLVTASAAGVVPASSSVPVAGDLASAVVGLIGWAYLAWAVTRDGRLGAARTGAAAQFARLYIYGVAYISLSTGLSALLDLSTRLVAAVGGPLAQAANSGSPVTMTPTSTEQFGPFISDAVMVLIAGALWAGHYAYANGRLSSPIVGQSERASVMRLAYLASAVMVCAGFVAVVCGLGIGALLDVVFEGASPGWWETPTVALLVTWVAVAAWRLHLRRGEADLAMLAPVARESAPVPARVLDWAACLAGILVVAFAAIEALTLLLDGSVRLGQIGSHENWVLQAVGVAQAGVIVWFLPFRRRGLAADRDPDPEVSAFSHRFYLFAVIGVLLLVEVVALLVVVHDAAMSIIGSGSNLSIGELAGPVAAFLVATPLLAMHVLLLLWDRTASRRTATETAPEDASHSGPDTQPRGVGGLRFVIAAPPGAEPEATRSTIAALLPPGFWIEPE